MDKGKELAKNTVIIAIGKISTQFISFLLLPLYTSRLTTAEYGVVDLFNTYVQLLLPVVTLMVEHGAFRYLLNDDNERSKKQIVTNSFFLICFLNGLFAVISLCGAKYVDKQYGRYLTILLIANSLANWAMQIARGFKVVIWYSIGSVVAVAVGIIFNVIFIVGMGWGAKGLLVATALGNLCCFLILFFKLKLYRYILIDHINILVTRQMLGYSGPLIPHQISLWVINSSDRMIVRIFLGMMSNGILAISHKFSSIIQIIYDMFQLSWQEMATVHFNDSDREEFYSKTIERVFCFFSSLCIGIEAILPFVFPLMIHTRYKEAYYTIPIYLLAAMLNIFLGLHGVVYVATKKTIEIARSTILAALINIVTHMFLIKYVGLYAAAISTCIAYFLVMVYRVYDVRKYINIKYRINAIVSVAVVYVIVSIAYYSKNIVLQSLGVLLSIIFGGTMNKSFIFTIIHGGADFLRKYR